MKLEVAVPAIAEAVAFAARHSPRVPAMPAMAGLLLEADAAGSLTCTGYDVEASSTMAVPAIVSEPGVLLLPGRPAAEILRSLPPVDAVITADDAAVRIAAADIDFTLPVLDPQDVAPLPGPPAPAGTVAGAALRQAVRQVASVTGRDVVPPVLTAVRLDLGEAELRFAATDKYRIALRTLPWRGSQPGRVLVPAHQLCDATAVLDPEREWTLGVDAAHLALRDGVRTCVLRLMDGVYPPIESVVPEGFASGVQVARGPFVQAVRRVCLADDQRARGAVVLTADGDSVEVSGGVGGTGHGRQRLPCQVTGESVRAAFTASYLIGALDSLEGEDARIELNPGVGKVLITGAPGYRHVVMSRRLPG